MPDAGPYRVDRLENPCVWRMHGPTYSRYFDSESDARWEAFTLNNVYRAALQRAQGVVEAARLVVFTAKNEDGSWTADPDHLVSLEEALADWDKGVPNA